MSSLLQEVGTPCPRRSKGSITSNSSGIGSDPFDSLWDDSLGNDDDTGNIDFTTEIRPSILTGAKPKRRAKSSTSFAIHSDHDEKPAQATVRPKQETRPAAAASNRKSSLLAQPAQRFRPRVSFAPSPLKHSQLGDVEPVKRIAKPHARENNKLLRQISANGKEAQAGDAIKRDVRRNTVYIPPEDTTVASVFMDLFSPLKSNNPVQYTPETTEINSLESRIARKRQAKRSVASPQRALQPSSKVTQESCISIDIPGKNGGKENMPPGTALVDVKKNEFKLDEVADKLSALELTVGSRGILASANANRPLTAKTANVPVQKKVSTGKVFRAPVHSDVGGRRALTAKRKDAATRSSTTSNTLKTSRSAMDLSVGRNGLKNLNQEYPLTSESITNPAMYNDNWINHQEVILTQLINGLFDQTSGAPADNSAILRHELHTLYRSPGFTDLHKRLQASLLYGALSIPNKVLLKASRLRQDLGMKQKFVDIWLQTYDPNALKAALETVTGRMIPAVKVTSSSIQSSTDASIYMDKSLKKKIGRFLDAFLIQNQDMDQEPRETDVDASGRAYRRTVLRSIMMVILLDKARISPQTPLSRCLFLASSPYKSSLAVVQVLVRFLLPSCGDISKALGQLECQVQYQQHPLEEYDYGLSNLAVDLRDGVRLAKMVEMLYPSRVTDRIETESSGEPQLQLSQRLRLPCLNRAVKVFNTGTALDALASTKEGRQLTNNIRPEDIVDGHREKTVALLWGLFSNRGLSGLVDLDDLRKEVSQLKQKATSLDELEDSDTSIESGDNEPAALLKQWACLVAQLRGLHSENIGNDKVYECILDEYEGYIVCPSTSIATLEDRLRAVGCSAQFINLVSPTKMHTPTLDTNSITGALAFLCSRLLPATKRVRAATVIQHAWRRVLSHRETKRRIVARDLARQCAAVVQTRDRILWAKGVIMQWWRLNKSRLRRRRLTVKDLGFKHGRKSTMTTTATATRIPLRRGNQSLRRIGV
ncbi:hypothetical protein BJX99DRAFT_207578 [Aspergillus californicus]